MIRLGKISGQLQEGQLLAKPNAALGKQIVALAAMGLPVWFFYLALFRAMRNLPMLDDYRVFLDFILRFQEAPSLRSKLLLFASNQHFEYKLIGAEALATAQWAITGHVNFVFLIVLGNLAILGIAWLLWNDFFAAELNRTRRIALFLPVCYLLFSLNYAEAVDLAEFGLQIGSTIFLVFASLHFLVRPGTRALVLACLSAALASFSNAPGLVLWPIGLLLLWPRRKPLQLVAWIGTFCLTACIYFYRFVPANMAADGRHTPLLQKAVFFLSFLGAAVENMSRFPVKGAAIAAGVVCFAIFLHASAHRFYRSEPFAFYAALWCLLTAALVAQGRSGLGLYLSLSLRYKIYSDLVLIFCYVYAVACFDRAPVTAKRKRHLYATALLSAVLLSIASDYFGLHFLANRQLRVQQGFDQWAADPAHNPPMVSLTDQPLPPEEPEACRVILNRAVAAGIYTPPASR